MRLISILKTKSELTNFLFDLRLVADVLLWKNWRGGVTLLISATTLWYLFERAGYNFLSFVANVILLLVVILFLWAKAANLLNRYFISSLSFCVFIKILCSHLNL